jgi:hypothetical protein
MSQHRFCQSSFSRVVLGGAVVVIFLILGAKTGVAGSRKIEFSDPHSPVLETNISSLNPSKLESDLLRRKLQEETFRPNSMMNNSLNGVMPRPVAPIQRTPAKSQKDADRDKNWMFLNAEEVLRMSSPEEIMGVSDYTAGAQNSKGLDAMQRYYLNGSSGFSELNGMPDRDLTPAGDLLREKRREQDAYYREHFAPIEGNLRKMVDSPSDAASIFGAGSSTLFSDFKRSDFGMQNGQTMVHKSLMEQYRSMMSGSPSSSSSMESAVAPRKDLPTVASYGRGSTDAASSPGSLPMNSLSSLYSQPTPPVAAQPLYKTTSTKSSDDNPYNPYSSSLPKAPRGLAPLWKN